MRSGLINLSLLSLFCALSAQAGGVAGLRVTHIAYMLGVVRLIDEHGRIAGMSVGVFFLLLILLAGPIVAASTILANGREVLCN